MTKKYDLADLIDIINDAVRETIAQDDSAEHDAAIYNMKANLFMGLAVAEHEAIWEVADAEN